MARGHAWMPARELPVTFTRASILDALYAVDQDQQARARVLALEVGFRQKIFAHLGQLIHAGAPFLDFATNPFVLMVFAAKNGYTRISQIESDILPGKLFSSMETSAGRMIEEVVRPVYGWLEAASAMHTSDSALDAVRSVGTTLLAATLKSGPRCLNDEMSENFADAVLAHSPAWVQTRGATALEFTYGALYGTKRQSNKKDWHILRNIHDKLGTAAFTVSPQGSWQCQFMHPAGFPVQATVRIGHDFWAYFGGQYCLVEVLAGLIRATVQPGVSDPAGHLYTIGDMAQIVSIPNGYDQYNVSVLQNSQLPWLFMLMRHFCDVMQ